MVNDPTRSERIDNPSNTGGYQIALERARAGEAAGGYLGNRDTVEAYVRSFIGSVVAEIREVGAGNKPLAEGSAEVEALCSRAAVVFMGADPAYTPVGPWNTSGSVGLFVRIRLAASLAGTPTGTPQDSLKLGFAVLALEVYALVKAWAASSDDDAAQGRVSELVEDWTDMLMGLPASGTASHDRVQPP